MTFSGQKKIGRIRVKIKNQSPNEYFKENVYFNMFKVKFSMLIIFKIN